LQKYQNFSVYQVFYRGQAGNTVQLLDMDDSKGIRAKIERPRVTSSVNSKSSPTGIPRAMVDVLTPKGESNLKI
jgi:hypothetical protein